MEIPNKFEPIIKEILQQLEEFEQAYGAIPEIKLVTKKNYNDLVRLVQNTTFRARRQQFQPLSSIPIKPGIHLFYPHVSLTQKKGFNRFNLAVYWKRKYKGKPWMGR